MLSVLLIDDEPALLEVLKPFVERSGEMSVHTAQSATEALKILPEKTFDAIIVDYSMPDIDGIEFLKILRSKGDTTPVIMFTGVGHERTAIDAINYGANFFLKKEEDPQMLFHELCDMVKTAVESKYIGKKIGTSRKIIADMINFSLDPSFSIDVEGKVVAWNASMEQLTDTPASDMIGKSDYLYTVPFFGTKRKMLINLIFEPDEEINRLLMIVAVLSRRLGLKLGSQDVMVNVTGGLKIDEPAADLGIALAIASSFRDASVDRGLAVVGEIGLSGELRAVPQLDRRVTEAARLGFKRILTPKAGGKIAPVKDIEVLAFGSLREAVERGMGG